MILSGVIILELLQYLFFNVSVFLANTKFQGHKLLSLFEIFITMQQMFLGHLLTVCLAQFKKKPKTDYSKFSFTHLCSNVASFPTRM